MSKPIHYSIISALIQKTNIKTQRKKKILLILLIKKDFQINKLKKLLKQVKTSNKKRRKKAIFLVFLIKFSKKKFFSLSEKFKLIDR
jgi:hypothetical protein